MDFNLCTPSQWVENEDTLLNQLKSDAVWDKIPLLNANDLQHLKDASLVRFRGMVQDMHSPEYYLEKFEVVNKTTKVHTCKNGKYCDAITSGDEILNFDSPLNVTSERKTFVVISVPGINQWVTSVEESHYKMNVQMENKPSSLKRSFTETMDTDTSPEPDNSNLANKKTCTVTNVSIGGNTNKVSKEYILNLPLPNRTGKACHLKVYKNSDELKINDVCEFVGFLGTNPLIDAAFQDADDFYSEMEMETLHPPSSLVPRIHCVSFKKLKHNNPLLTENETMDASELAFVREELLIVLTQLLLGDKLAAEYLILNLISEVYLRRDFLPLGKFSLNISNIPNFDNLDYVSELYKFIEKLVPKSHYLPMTLDNMNDLSFIPKKDYECSRLTSGILQLSPNTMLVLDETKLNPGRLNAAGLTNLKAVDNTIRYQRVNYEFNYFQLEFDCDIPFLILSEGKSMLNSDVHVVLKPEQFSLETFHEILMAADHFLKPELLRDIRKYLTLARLTNYKLTDQVEGMVQNELVRMRQNGAASVNDLHSMLVLARLVSISHGKADLDEECWQKARKLQEECKARITK